jgi:hypothetical protein
MPTFTGRVYEVRRGLSAWFWMAFALDRTTSIGRGESPTKADAERAAQACIAAATGALS